MISFLMDYFLGDERGRDFVVNCFALNMPKLPWHPAYILCLFENIVVFRVKIAISTQSAGPKKLTLNHYTLT